MNRYSKVSDVQFKDTETGHEMLIYDKQIHSFVDLANDVASGLNLILSLRLRRGSKAGMSRNEFSAMHAAYLNMQRDNPDNILIRDVVKLCNLVTSHHDEIKFSS